MTPISTPPPGLVRRLLLRLLLVLVFIAVAVGIPWIVTGQITLVGLQALVAGLGTAIFGGGALVCDDIGRRAPSAWTVYGVVAGLVGSVLVVVSAVTLLPFLLRVIGICFVIVFASVRGSLVEAVAVGSVDRGTQLLRRLATFSIGITMTLCTVAVHQGITALGLKLLGISILVETGAVIALLVRRAEHRHADKSTNQP